MWKKLFNINKIVFVSYSPRSNDIYVRFYKLTVLNARNFEMGPKNLRVGTDRLKVTRNF